MEVEKKLPPSYRLDTPPLVVVPLLVLVVVIVLFVEVEVDLVVVLEVVVVVEKILVEVVVEDGGKDRAFPGSLFSCCIIHSYRYGSVSGWNEGGRVLTGRMSGSIQLDLRI